MILQRTADEIDKRLAIVTKDAQVRKWCEQLGIKTAVDLDLLEVPQYLKHSRQRSKFIDQKPAAPARKKPTASLQAGTRDLLNRVTRPNIALLTTVIGLSFALLFFIASVALPGATIKIMPQKKAAFATLNITFLRNSDAANVDLWAQQQVIVTPLKMTLTQSTDFLTTGRNFIGTAATGVAIVSSSASEELSFRPHSRLQSPAGNS